MAKKRLSKVQSPKSKAGKHAGGRPSAFLPEFVVQARNFALLGFTDKVMALQFGVSEVTFNAWKKEYPEFLKSLNEGKAVADAKVAHSLYQRATGFEITVQKVVNGEVQDCKEFIPGDPGAQKLWLTNRQREIWRDKPDVNVTVNNETGVTVDLKKPPEDWGKEELEAALAQTGGLEAITGRNGHKPKVGK